MSDPFPVLKDEEDEQPVPTLWRTTFHDIVEAFVHRDFTLERGVEGVAPISREEGKRVSDYIGDYGCSLISLPQEAWDTSVSRWLEGYWEVLVDLFTLEEGLSDLVLFARVFEEGDAYRFELMSVHVP